MVSETPRELLSIWGSDSPVRAQDLLPPTSSTLSGHGICLVGRGWDRSHPGPCGRLARYLGCVQPAVFVSSYCSVES